MGSARYTPWRSHLIISPRQRKLPQPRVTTRQAEIRASKESSREKKRRVIVAYTILITIALHNSRHFPRERERESEKTSRRPYGRLSSIAGSDVLMLGSFFTAQSPLMLLLAIIEETREKN